MIYRGCERPGALAHDLDRDVARIDTREIACLRRAEGADGDG